MTLPRDIKPYCPDFKVKYLGKRIYELTYYDKVNARHYHLATGSAVTTRHKIGVPHRLIKVVVKHADASDADNTDAFTWSWKRNMMIPGKALFSDLVSYSSDTGTDFDEAFGEEYPMPGMEYQFIQNTTVNHRIYLVVQIQILDDGIWQGLA